MVKDEATTNSKQRILDAAVRLFARKGYAGTGMRELAAEANVKLAAINYFFGCKLELLKAVLDEFFRRYAEVGEEALSGDDPPELKLRRFIRSAIGFFRENPCLLLIVLTEFPYDVPEIAEFKADRLRKLAEALRREELLPLEKLTGKPVPMKIIGPALTTIMASHFLLRPVLEKIPGVSFDEAFYERYPEVIADLFIYGLLGTSPSPRQGLPPDIGLQPAHSLDRGNNP